MMIERALECGVAREGDIDGKKESCNSKRVIMTTEAWATTVKDFRQQENRTMAKELTTVSASAVNQMFVYKLTNSFVFCLVSSITDP